MNADLLADIESCDRRGLWAQSWQAQKIYPTKMLYMAIEQAMTQTERPDRGQFAGEVVMDLCAERGIDTRHPNRYDVGLHHAALADLIVTYLSSQPEAPWTLPGVSTLGWEPSAFLAANGTQLVRVILVDHIDEERQKAETHSWHSLGNMLAYELPMSLEIIVLGQSRSGRRHSAWTTGLLHPRNRKLRFQKKSKIKQPDYGFAESWRKIWREEYAQIDRDQWLQAMREDGMLDELTRKVLVNLPGKARLDELRAIVARKEQGLRKLSGMPDPSYSGCWWPRPCPFASCCFGQKEQPPSLETGFVERR